MKTLTHFVLLVLTVNGFSKTQAQNNASFTPVLNSYFALQKDLSNDSSMQANEDAGQFVTAVKKVNVAALKGQQKADWQKYSEQLRYNGQHISESKSIDHQREHFAALSNEMYALVKSSKPATTVYREYCPMKKEYWLSSGTEIRNPYYGKSMLDCGKVIETIKGTE